MHKILASTSLLFVRHGETDYNRRAIRCGGDVDIPLTERGREQAAQAGMALHPYGGQIGAIFTAPLERTRETGAIIARALQDPAIFVHEGLTERRLGEWNGLAIDATQGLIERGETPPGGESEAAFQRRVARTLFDLVGRGYALPLLVSSKGVARVTNLLLGDGAAAPLENAAVLSCDITQEALERLRVVGEIA